MMLHDDVISGRFQTSDPPVILLPSIIFSVLFLNIDSFIFLYFINCLNFSDLKNVIGIDREMTEIGIETEIAREIENGNGNESESGIEIVKGNASGNVSEIEKRRETENEKENGNEKR